MQSETSRLATFAIVVLSLAACPASAREGTPSASLSDLTATVDHPLVPLATITNKVFLGEALDAETSETIAIRVAETVPPRSVQVAGTRVTIVNVDTYHNGELVKTTAGYFAQGPDGTVYSLGERVDEYETGQLVSHEGAWLAGGNGNQPGLFMPDRPAVGDAFQQERIPGIAEARTTVIATDQTVTTVAGRFDGCIVTEDTDLPDGQTERKTYCPGIGLVRQEFPRGRIELMHYASTGDVDASETKEQAGAIDEGEVFLSAAAITLEESIIAAQAATPGEIGEVDLEVTNEGIVFIVEVGQSEVYVEAETGLTLSVLTADEP